MNEIAKSYPQLILGFIILSALFAAIRFIFSQHLESKKVSFQKIELINNILKFNINKPNSRQKFLTEQAFSAVFGRFFSFNEVKALLNYESPSEAVLLFLKGRQFLKVSRSGKTLVLKSKYRKFTLLKIDFYLQNIKFFFLYILFALINIFPITVIFTIYSNNSWFAHNLGFINIFWAFIAGLLTIVLILLALLSMLQSGKIDKAFKLVAKNS
jgi:hypothetical protein